MKRLRERLGLWFQYKGIEIWQPTPEEWEDYKAQQLGRLGLTYTELASQAVRGQFQSTEARHLWVIIGRKEGLPGQRG